MIAFTRFRSLIACGMMFALSGCLAGKILIPGLTGAGASATPSFTIPGASAQPSLPPIHTDIDTNQSTTVTLPETPTQQEAKCRSYLSSLAINPAGLLPVPPQGITQRNNFIADGGRLVVYDGRYYAVWIPDTYYAKLPHTVFYDLHGTNGYPEADWNDWHTALKDKGIAFIGYAWGGSTIKTDTQIYAAFKAISDNLSASCPISDANNWVSGFSVGSAMSYAIVIDDLADRKMFKGNIANSGSAWSPLKTKDVTMHPRVEAVKSSSTAYKGAISWMYCGEMDFDHGWSMCDEMDYARTLVESQGGIATLYRDPTGVHGGLTKNTTALSTLFTQIGAP